MERMGNPLSSALDTLQTAVGRQVSLTETLVGTAVRGIRAGSLKWGVFTQIVAASYAFLAVIIAFAREDFLNVTRELEFG